MGWFGRLGRGEAPAFARRAAAMLAVALASSLLGAGAAARSATVRGIEMSRFGRIVLEFDRETKVQVSDVNGVLVLAFPEAAKIQGERLARELPSYVTQVRHDPDGRGLRVALTQGWRLNVLEAAEKVFIDLLPANWSGLLPALPPEVVDALARRAREAEARAGEEALRRREQRPRDVSLRVATLPTLTRLVLEPVGGVPIALKVEGHAAEVRIDAPATLKLGGAKTQIGAAVRSIESVVSGSSARLILVLEDGSRRTGFARTMPSLSISRDRSSRSLRRKPGSNRRLSRLPRDRPRRRPRRPGPSRKRPTDMPMRRRRGARISRARSRRAPRSRATGSQSSSPSMSGRRRRRSSAAASRRSCFRRKRRLNSILCPRPRRRSLRSAGSPGQGAFTVLRFTLTGPALTRLAQKGDSWVLSIGGTGLTPSEPLTMRRNTDDLGRTLLHLGLGDAAGVLWLEDAAGGERIAVATAYGPARSIAKPQRFVEFRLLPSAHGVAVVADAEDLAVRSGWDGVTISREMGLAVTMDDAASGMPDADSVLDRERWNRDRLGSVLARQRELSAAVIEAPRSGRSAARIELARFLMANRLDPEAVGVLSAAALDDPTLTRQRQFLLLQAIALARANRAAEARRVLATDVVAEDPEAVLWRAALDARAKRWAAALATFRRAKASIDAYPDDIQVTLRIAMARAAIETNDIELARSEAIAAGRLGPEPVQGDEIALLKGRVAEAEGRRDVALDLYRRLAETAERPVAAEATLRWVTLALAEGAMQPDEGIARLETLAVAWRGDEIEAGALGQLGRLYAGAGRWRDAFTAARRASRIFPDHDLTRALHEDTGRLFEDLFLSGKGESLSRVDALALYFDFKEFTPIGRRGDEIVRRLSDRLVELDLLDQAGDLLWHQVEHRLSGAARATVAARLATVRLMDGKPQAALQTIQATRLPELPAAIKRARILLEARALSDLSRTDLALDVIAGESGPEIERLRADILWTGRRWRDAGEEHEGLVGTRWQDAEALGDRERRDVLRAAIAYSLADEALALERLRTRYAAKMADSRDARVFAFLTQPKIASAAAFREIARGVTSADTLAEFLAEYRKRYPEAAVAERRRAPVPAEPSAKPQAQAPMQAPAKG